MILQPTEEPRLPFKPKLIGLFHTKQTDRPWKGPKLTGQIQNEKFPKIGIIYSVYENKDWDIPYSGLTLFNLVKELLTTPIKPIPLNIPGTNPSGLFCVPKWRKSEEQYGIKCDKLQDSDCLIRSQTKDGFQIFLQILFLRGSFNC